MQQSNPWGLENQHHGGSASKETFPGSVAAEAEGNDSGCAAVSDFLLLLTFPSNWYKLRPIRFSGSQSSVVSRPTWPRRSHGQNHKYNGVISPGCASPNPGPVVGSREARMLLIYTRINHITWLFVWNLKQQSTQLVSRCYWICSTSVVVLPSRVFMSSFHLVEIHSSCCLMFTPSFRLWIRAGFST